MFELKDDPPLYNFVRMDPGKVRNETQRNGTNHNDTKRNKAKRSKMSIKFTHVQNQLGWLNEFGSWIT